MDYISIVPVAFAWWYSRGLADLFSYLEGLFVSGINSFSVPTVLKTLFAPWKKDVNARQPGIDGLKIWLLDNFVSRMVGFFMRLGMIFVFFLYMIFVFILGAVALVLWLGMPAFLLLSLIWIFT